MLSLFVAFTYFGNKVVFRLGDSFLAQGAILVDILVALAVFYYTCVRFHRYWIALLEAIQLGAVLWFEYVSHGTLDYYADIVVDNFTLIMILIAGVIGSLIAVFSLGYMEAFQKEHRDVRDRRDFFFFVLFLFLSAMFGLVVSNNLLYMYTFWEITSVCSFLLIGYTESRVAVNNSFKLWMNLLGGAAFAAAIIVMGLTYHSTALSHLVGLALAGMPVTVILALLLLCGFTKSAMMPFSGWLLGAMVAPTPTSALLHSSTMVKAGVFLIIKLCPALGNNHAGTMAMFVGGITFFFASCAAISQSDGKKVLAYSTISNLGLIVCCAGIGSYEAAWTAIMIVIFHAVAKSLLFLSVGTAEQQLGSRDIERFDGLFNAMPHLCLCMVIGISGMFLAPFGMLISKWAAMKAFIDAGHPMLLLLLVFGSATTIFYWAKWLGKILSVMNGQERREQGITKGEWFTLKTLSWMTIIVCILFPLISSYGVLPYLRITYGFTRDVIAQSNLIIMSLMVVLLVILPSRYGKGQPKRKVGALLAGVNTGDDRNYLGAGDNIIPVELRNWYMEEWFGEKKMKLSGFALCMACIFIQFAIILGGVYRG
jgi:ech hydrogenase subunit A